MNDFIPLLIVTVALATALNLLLKRFKLPTVIGYICTGILMRGLFDVDLHDDQGFESISEFGIVFLMFTIGLEFSLAHLGRMKKEVFVYGGLQVILTTALLATLGCWLTEVDARTCILAASGLALSSTAIVLKVLNESGRIKSPVGRNTVGILIFQDIAVIPILLMASIFTEQDKDLSGLLLSTLLNAVAALAVLVGIGKFVFPRLFKAVSATNSKEIYMGCILLAVIGASYIAHAFGFSYSLGAFIAGMMIAETIYKYQIEADLIPFRDLLLGVFFFSVGLQIDVGAVLLHLPAVVALGVGIMVVKTACLFAILALFGNGKTAFKSALTLAQVGEFALVVFSLLLANGMMDAVSVQILMVITIASMVTTPLLISHADALANRLFKEKISQKVLDQAGILGGHIILCGFGEFGRAVSERFEHAGIAHVVVTNNTEAFVKASELGRSVVFGDPADAALLEQLHIRDAASTVLALDDFDEIRKASAAITLIDPEIKVIAKVLSEGEKAALGEFNHELLLDGNSQVAAMLVERIHRSQLMAREALQLQYLADYSLDDPDDAIQRVHQEQARLLEIMSRSFNALRENKNVMEVKALHDSFAALREIIGEAITNLLKHAAMTPRQFERISTLLAIQDYLQSTNQTLEKLGKELYALHKYPHIAVLTQIAVEGLDAILLILIDLARHYDSTDAIILSTMAAGRGNGLSKIRESYLAAEQSDLDAATKASLLASTNHIERLKGLFGRLGDSYKKLAEAAA